MFQVIAGMALATALGIAPTAQAPTPAETHAQVKALREEVAELKRQLQELQRLAVPELGQQMLELQIRHARLWFAGTGGDWTLAAFQLAELREALNAIVEANPDHETIQPERLADVLPTMMKPSIASLQTAIDKRDAQQFAQAYDQLTQACNACHASHSFDFNQFQRPVTPFLDNQRYTPPAKAKP
jgi:hypothetical protein